MSLSSELAIPPKFLAIYVRCGSVKSQPFPSLDEALYFLWLFQRRQPSHGSAKGIWDGRILYACCHQDIDGYGREALGLPYSHVFDGHGYIETGYYWDGREYGDAKRFCQGLMPLSGQLPDPPLRHIPGEDPKWRARDKR